MSENTESNNIVYEKRPIWHSPPWITAIVGLIGTFLTVPEILGNYFQQQQEINILETKNLGARQEQELLLVKETLNQKGTERIFLLRYLSATADDDEARNWAESEVERFVKAGVSLEEQLGIVEKTYSLRLIFNPSEVTLSHPNIALLDSIVEDWKAAKDFIIVVTGHTDNAPISTTLFQSNFHLSLARAEVVANYLESKLGIKPEKIKIEGRGDTEPLVSNNSVEGREVNDRVDISIIGQR